MAQHKRKTQSTAETVMPVAIVGMLVFFGLPYLAEQIPYYLVAGAVGVGISVIWALFTEM